MLQFACDKCGDTAEYETEDGYRCPEHAPDRLTDTDEEINQ